MERLLLEWRGVLEYPAPFRGSPTIINAHAMANYQLSPRWALGLSYQFVNLDLDVEKDNLTQVYDIDFSGAMVYARFSF